jgi:hypothetical protein
VCIKVTEVKIRATGGRGSGQGPGKNYTNVIHLNPKGGGEGSK